ncbi:class D sortase [Colidextribacter sp. OB.20]|uniref:class D sortase n=1 Tax=Colidextribacter sp. OB.20 TaxID=2304568 RepID=UPI00136C6737|nr:class D sortase [Colidextribacter sp. OB.20]NBI11821.1 class D sortase [Colidextribacter sp. OB.20]
MKKLNILTRAVLPALALLALAPSAYAAADYSFETTAPQDYYKSTSYEDIYGSQYNYGGRNVVDYQVPELEYGRPSTTMTGVMERTILPGLQQSVATGGGGYGISGGGPVTDLAESGRPGSTVITAPTYQRPAYTSVEGMAYKDGHIGTVKIPSLKISMKLWEGETNASMKKGLGHYSSTSAWDGNVGICGHNRGAKYSIGSIKNLEQGDTITYTTVYGTRTYAVETVKIISNTDWSYLQATTDNRITLTTCLADHPESRVVVQAVETRS